jgi:hypothetical protein
MLVNCFGSHLCHVSFMVIPLDADIYADWRALVISSSSPGKKKKKVSVPWVSKQLPFKRC